MDKHLINIARIQSIKFWLAKHNVIRIPTQHTMWRRNHGTA